MASNTIPPITPRGPYMDWCTAHAAAFAANAVAIGLTVPKATAYATLLTAADKAITDADKAKAAYRAAVVSANEAVRALSTNLNGTGELVRTVRAFAESQANPDTVYSLAQIDPPTPAAPLPAPNAPENVTVGLDTTSGAVVLKWKASQVGSGTVYIVKRRINSTGAWEFVGTAGSDKTFTDASLAAGPDSVQYSIQAQRSNLFSDATAVVVNFGVGNGPTLQSVKLAA